MNFVTENYNTPNTPQITSATQLKSFLSQFDENLSSFEYFIWNEADIPDSAFNSLKSNWQTLTCLFTDASNALINQNGDLRTILQKIIDTAMNIKSKNFTMPDNTLDQLKGCLDKLKEPIENALKLLPSEQPSPDNSESQK